MLTKTGPKRLRKTRREVTFGQKSLWGCKRSEFCLTRPDRFPLVDEGDDAVDSIWTSYRSPDSLDASLWEIQREIEDGGDLLMEAILACPCGERCCPYVAAAITWTP